MQTHKFSREKEIFAQGAPSEALYVIESGWVRLTREEKGARFTIATLGPGDLLGEEDFLLDRPYSVGAEATSEVTAWKLAKADLLAVIREEPQIGVKLSLALASLVAGMADYVAEQRLAKTSLFSPLPPHLLLDMARRLQPKGYERGEKICQAGDPGEAIYIVESGRIEVISGVEGEEVVHLGEGRLFGEMAVLSGRAYGATHRAATQVTLWALSKEEFGRLAQAHPILRRIAGEYLRTKAFGPPVAVEPVKERAPRVRLPLPPRPVSLAQGARRLVAAFRDLIRWQAQQRRAIRIELGVIVLLLIWLCGISAPTAVISSMTGGEGMVALLATSTPTFTPSPIPTDTPTMAPTFTSLPTDTPVPSPTPTPTELAEPPPAETPVATSTATPKAPALAVAPTATPTATPTPTPSPVSPPMVTRVYDHEGNEKDIGWAWNEYGVSVDRATPGPAYRVVELREKLGSANIDVWVLDEAGQPIVGVYVRMSWPGEDSPADLLTESDGNAGSGELGKESCYRGEGTKADVFSGSLSFEVLGGDIPSDIARGFGWICGTNHDHMEIVFRLVR